MNYEAMGQGEIEQFYFYLIWTYLFPNLEDCIIFQLIIGLYGLVSRAVQHFLVSKRTLNDAEK